MFFFFKQMPENEMRISDWISVVCSSVLISLQLKAVSTSFNVLRQYPVVAMPPHENLPLLADTALWVALVMAAFAILFGTRHIDAAEHHEGMVAAIAFESLVKLVAFLAVGLLDRTSTRLNSSH